MHNIQYSHKIHLSSIPYLYDYTPAWKQVWYCYSVQYTQISYV